MRDPNEAELLLMMIGLILAVTIVLNSVVYMFIGNGF
jgi:hypothetical protein